MVQGDFDNFYIYVDADGSGDIEGGETTKVCATEATTAISRRYRHDHLQQLRL